MAGCSAVFDSSAVIALLRSEPWIADIESYVASAGLSVVNLAEIASKLSDWQMPETRLNEFLIYIDIAILPYDVRLAYETGRLRAATRNHGLSLGDRACLATAMQLAVPAITADRNWRHLKIGVDITVIH